MNIGFVLYSYPGIGGTESVTNLLADYFMANGHDISIISWKRPKDHTKCHRKVIYLPNQTELNSTENNKFIEGLSKSHLDCIINQGPFWIPTPQLKQSRCFIVSVLHYSPNYKISSQRNSIVELYESRHNFHSFSKYIKATVRYLFKDYFSKRDFDKLYKPELIEQIENSDKFVVLCEQYISLLNIITNSNHKNIRAIPNGIILPESGKNQKEKLIVCIGRLSRWDKRVDRLLYIWSKIHVKNPDWNLKILGDGDDRKRLEQISTDLKLTNYSFEGFVDIHPYLEKASVLCMTSSSEGFPMVLLEAQSYGVVPIAYNVSSGIEYLIKDGENGFIVNPFDESKYISCLLSLMSDGNRRVEMSEFAHSRAQMFSVQKMGKYYLDMIQNGVRDKQTKKS